MCIFFALDAGPSSLAMQQQVAMRSFNASVDEEEPADRGVDKGLDAGADGGSGEP